MPPHTTWSWAEDWLARAHHKIEVHASGAVVLAVLLTVTIFIVDLVVPLGISIWFLYLVPYLLLAFATPSLLGWTMVAFILLLLVGFLVSPPGPVGPGVALLNRIIFCLSLLPVTGLLVLIRREREHLIAENIRRRQAEASLRMANEKLQLLSNITRHDITNQLTGLMGRVALLREEAGDPALEPGLDAIATATEQAASLIRFTGEYQRIGVDLPVWQDLRALVTSAERSVSLGSVHIANEIPPGAEIFAEALVGRVFVNLVENAVRHGRTITTIRFSVSQQGETPMIICEDDGSGIPLDEKERIFERGFGRNTGFGLFLSREILAIAGIEIRETGRPGEGARFELRVPPGEYRVVLGPSGHRDT